MLSAASLLTIASCSKSKNEPEQLKNEITISGTAYPTVVIGTQTWTTVNYNGNGGVNYNNGANDPTVGKLYSYQELQALLNLPAGWRVPTEADAKKMMRYLGTTINTSGGQWDGEEHLSAEKSKKITSKATWATISISGNNETGLNIYPNGNYFPTSNPTTNPEYNNKGTEGSFWLSTKDNNRDALYLEVSFSKWDASYDNWSTANPLLATYIVGTTAYEVGFSEKRSIRFVKDN